MNTTDALNAIYLTEAEVAARLGCSTRRVQWLRLTGKLTYVAGRPVLISERALEAYVERARAAKLPKPKPAKGEPKPYGFMTPAMYARFVWLRRQRAREEKAKGK